MTVELNIAASLEKLIQTHQLNEWARLLTDLACSFFLSLAFTSGMALLAHRSPLEALGAGLVAASTHGVYLWRKAAPRGGTLAIPEAEAGEEMKENQQMITK